MTVDQLTEDKEATVRRMVALTDVPAAQIVRELYRTHLWFRYAVELASGKVACESRDSRAVP